MHPWYRQMEQQASNGPIPHLDFTVETTSPDKEAISGLEQHEYMMMQAPMT